MWPVCMAAPSRPLNCRIHEVMKTPAPVNGASWRTRFVRQDEKHRLFWSLVAGAVAFLLLGQAPAAMRAVAAWDVFTFCFLAMAGIAIFSATPGQIKRNANAQDPGRHVVFFFALAAACASLFAVILMLHSAKGLKGADLGVHLGISIFAIITSWMLIHTVFAFRFAHMFYDEAEDGEEAEEGGHVGGLDFPGDEKEPDYVDFAYFSFVIGMTFQVSDVEISSRAIRRVALSHSMLSFGFNTMIVALSVNIISSLIGH